MAAAKVCSSILHEPCIIQFFVVSVMSEADIEPTSMAGKVVRQSNSVTVPTWAPLLLKMAG